MSICVHNFFVFLRLRDAVTYIVNRSSARVLPGSGDGCETVGHAVDAKEAQKGENDGFFEINGSVVGDDDLPVKFLADEVDEESVVCTAASDEHSFAAGGVAGPPFAVASIIGAITAFDSGGVACIRYLFGDVLAHGPHLVGNA